MVQKWSKNLQHCEDLMVFCLISGLAHSLCASATPCNLSNVTTRTQCDGMPLGLHWGCT